MKFVKALLFICSTLITALCLIFVPEASGPVSVTYTSVLGFYLGLDVAEMITSSASMKKGEYAKLHTHKYIISLICVMSLIIIYLFLKDKSNLTTAITSFISASLILIGCLIGGLEGNKIATNVGDPK